MMKRSAIRLDLKVTYRCNNACRFCVQKGKRSLADPGTQVLRSILRREASPGREVVLTGGEPTLREDLFELIGAARKAGYGVQLQTNGRIFAYPDRARRAAEAGLGIAAVSLHSHNAAVQDGLTRVPGSFSQTVRGIENLLRCGLPVVTNTVINKKNYRSLASTARFLMKLGVAQFQFSYPHIAGRARDHHASLVVRKSRVMPYLFEALETSLKGKAFPKVEAIPLCFLGPYGPCSTESALPPIKTFEDKGPRDFTAWVEREGKVKGPVCRVCDCFGRCNGPWREYPELFGWEEFHPVSRTRS